MNFSAHNSSFCLSKIESRVDILKNRSIKMFRVQNPLARPVILYGGENIKSRKLRRVLYNYVVRFSPYVFRNATTKRRVDANDAPFLKLEQRLKTSAESNDK